MDNHNKYRGNQPGHLYGQTNVSPSNIHKDCDRRCRKVEEHIRQIATQTNQYKQHGRIDLDPEPSKCHLRECTRNHGQLKQQDYPPLPRIQRHNECLKTMNCYQKNPGHSPNPREVNENNQRYPKQDHKPQLHLPSHNRNAEARHEHARGDHLLYKNTAFDAPNSSRSEHGDEDVGRKGNFNFLGSAQAHCEEVNERFRRKLHVRNEEPFASTSGSSSKKSKNAKPTTSTMISAKSGEDLKKAVRSQINMQQALDRSIREGLPNRPVNELDDKMEEVLESYGRASKGKNKKHHWEDSKPPAEDALDTPGEDARSNRTNTDNLPQLDFSVSADDIVSSKVIDPMIRKIQRMYLNTLRSEMAIMEYLERVPKLVSDVYKREAVEKSQKI